jgi:hypothetical protein
MSGVLEERPVILVANKTDLVRKRVVKTPGKSRYFSHQKRTVSRAYILLETGKDLCYMHRKRLDCYDEHKVIFYIFI